MERENGYRWDVFISYPHGEHDGEVAGWVTEIFLDDFRQRLRESLGRSPEIFIDKQNLIPGGQWDLMLMNALGRSRIMVPIWCVGYFESEYCRKELAVMLHRERELGYRTVDKPDGLIMPVQIWDGSRYPLIARGIQQLTCAGYGNVKKHSDEHRNLQNMIEGWVVKLVPKIEKPPDWNPAWLDSNWLDQAFGAFEQSRLLWPPAKISYLESMGWNDGDGDEEENG